MATNFAIGDRQDLPKPKKTTRIKTSLAATLVTADKVYRSMTLSTGESKGLGGSRPSLYSETKTSNADTHLVLPGHKLR